ncbi:hypothetical protein [Pseudomonas typographi]|uniref:Uncharacterized protein n=1 Tax=Pseudomonas typographi TaxID=2715964 RepID=A0ABR7Z388_9PSED|nr:hypothetical protein [Pseudomonas typographi]MBD1586101.1 hypothetical protein [Pseudomonas typographi]MBD1599959.1 hypothetical protein [Pseudomonas typographi]
MTLHSLDTPTRNDPWARDLATECVRFVLNAQPQPDVACRVMNLLAMQYLMAHHAHLQVQHGVLRLELEVAQVSWHRAQLIAQRMRGLVDVDDVVLEAVRPMAALA